MSVVWWIALHGLATVGALSLVFGVAPKAIAAKQARGHDARMARIAQLEISNGYGLDYAREWVERQKPRGDGLRYTMIGKLHCYGCGGSYTRNGSDELRLCPTCRGSAR